MASALRRCLRCNRPLGQHYAIQSLDPDASYCGKWSSEQYIAEPSPMTVDQLRHVLHMAERNGDAGELILLLEILRLRRVEETLRLELANAREQGFPAESPHV